MVELGTISRCSTSQLGNPPKDSSRGKCTAPSPGWSHDPYLTIALQDLKPATLVGVPAVEEGLIGLQKPLHCIDSAFAPGSDEVRQILAQ